MTQTTHSRTAPSVMPYGPLMRHHTVPVNIGGVIVGGGAPVVVQSMTNNATEDRTATANQIFDLWEAGSELVRITVNTPDAAAQVPYIVEDLAKRDCFVPVVGDFHYNGHRLLNDFPACARALAKYRINPGNVGFGDKRDTQFAQMVETALHFNKPVRIGVNWGSLDQALLTQLMDDNAKAAQPRPAHEINMEAIIQSALLSAQMAEELGLGRDKIVISCKVSRVQEVITVYRELARRSDYALHVGLTEAGMGSKGIVASTAALGILLQEGIGDTIRVSLTPEPGADRRLEVQVCQQILQTMNFRAFTPMVTACPGCGRTTVRCSRNWRKRFKITSRPRCRCGKKPIRAWKACRLRSWAVSSTGRGKASMPISASVCPAPAKSRRPRSLSMAKKSPPCAVTGLLKSFRPWSKTMSIVITALGKPHSRPK